MMPGEGITALIVAAGAGVIPPTAGDWPIYEGRFPATVAQCILVKEAGGRQPEVRVAINYPSIQILVRGKKAGYVLARAKIEEIFVALQAIPSAPTEYPELDSCIAVADPTFVGYDENEYPIWSLNFNLITSKAPTGYRDL